MTFEVAFRIDESGLDAGLTKEDLRPVKATDSSMAFDLFLPTSVTVEPFKVVEIDMKIKFSMPEQLHAILGLRSSIAKKGMHTLAGWIDGDYRGNIILIIHCLSLTQHTFEAGSRIAQVRFVREPPVTLDENLTFTATSRGEHGLGSSGTTKVVLYKKL